MDKQILTRGTAGLLRWGSAPNNPSAESTAAAYLAAVYAGADGIYAQSAMEVRMLVGADNLRSHGRAGRIAATGNDVNAAEKVMSVSGGLRVSGHVPDYANNKQEALVIKGMSRRNMPLLRYGRMCR